MASSCSWLPCCASVGASRLLDPCASVVVHRGVSGDSRGLMVPAAGTRRKPLGSSHCLTTRLQCNNPDTNASTAPETEEEEEEEEEKAFARLGQYVELNAGSWSGTFTQYDGLGKTLACVPIKLKASTYGKGEHVSLYQTLYVKQAKSSTSVSGDEEEVPEWVEYNIQEIDALTINRLHKVGYFADEKAYCLSHLTAEMLDAVLRAGLLGEDDDEATDIFPGVRFPCRRPALVSESCLYSESGNSRVRAFHVFNPQGLLDMIGVFHEHREEEDIFREDGVGRMQHLLGQWSGHAVTQRTGIYGSTLTEQELLINIEKKNNDGIVQTISRTSEDIKLVLNGTMSGDVMRFMDGLQTTLLPGGMSMTSPVSVGNCVRASRSFCLEFSWIDTPQRRRRLVRTYDTSGMVVSTTLSKESRV